MSEDWEARANRSETLLQEIKEFCEDVFDHPTSHVPPWESEAWTVEGRPTREQHLAARISSIIENAGKGPAFVATRVDPPEPAHEDDSPVFRVHLWRQREAPEGTPQDQVAWELEAYEVGDVDVHEVLDWASWRVERGPRGVTMWPGPTRVWVGLVVGEGDERTLIRLAGKEPTSQ